MVDQLTRRNGKARALPNGFGIVSDVNHLKGVYLQFLDRIPEPVRQLIRLVLRRGIREGIHSGEEPAAELDLKYYRRRVTMQKLLPATLLQQHFHRRGAAAGIPGSRACWRDQMTAYAQAHSSVLEIGPFCSPMLKGSNVRYFDVLDSAGLAERAKRVGRKPEPPAIIHYVSPNGDLGVVTERFEAVFSCHCIEHQPDLVKHLKQVAEILPKGGRYYLVIPDKRFCFDHFLPESGIAQVIAAHVEERATHTVESVLEHRALITHNDARRHWQGDHFSSGSGKDLPKKVHEAVQEYLDAAGSYIDVHAWKFTPEGFRQTMDILFEAGFIPLSAERVYNTPRGTQEFCAILRK